MKLVIENGALMGFDMEGEEIPEEVFDLRIPMGVVEIADEAFAADEGQSPYLGRVIIPDSVERIGKWAFFGHGFRGDDWDYSISVATPLPFAQAYLTFQG